MSHAYVAEPDLWKNGFTLKSGLARDQGTG